MITGLGEKNISSLPSPGRNYFKSLGDDSDEPI